MTLFLLAARTTSGWLGLAGSAANSIVSTWPMDYLAAISASSSNRFLFVLASFFSTDNLCFFLQNKPYLVGCGNHSHAYAGNDQYFKKRKSSEAWLAVTHLTSDLIGALIKNVLRKNLLCLVLACPSIKMSYDTTV